jgi:hypothetical protein
MAARNPFQVRLELLKNDPGEMGAATSHNRRTGSGVCGAGGGREQSGTGA